MDMERLRNSAFMHHTIYFPAVGHTQSQNEIALSAYLGDNRLKRYAAFANTGNILDKYSIPFVAGRHYSVLY